MSNDTHANVEFSGHVIEVDHEASRLLVRFEGMPPDLPAEVAVLPIDMVLYCPNCGMQHIDQPENFTTDEDASEVWENPPHRSHLCRTEDGGCGTIWRPADVPTNGVAALKTKGNADTWLVLSGAFPLGPVLPEPAAYMLPSHLDEFQHMEVCHEACSVSFTNVDTGERSVPLFTAEQMRAANAGVQSAATPKPGKVTLTLPCYIGNVKCGLLVDALTDALSNVAGIKAENIDVQMPHPDGVDARGKGLTNQRNEGGA